MAWSEQAAVQCRCRMAGLETTLPLDLPVKQPDVVVPVVELILKDA